MNGRIVRCTVVVACLVVLLPSLAAAQAEDRRGWAYLFGAVARQPGERGAFTHLGGGGERVLVQGFGIGAELGYFAPAGQFGDGVGMLSLSPAGYFKRAGRTTPFATAGASLLFRGTMGAGAGHAGGGLQHWVNRGTALRGEYRLYVFAGARVGHSVRAGISFR